jgi:hypothetical protein
MSGVTIVLRFCLFGGIDDRILATATAYHTTRTQSHTAMFAQSCGECMWIFTFVSLAAAGGYL